jgi:hypothetical protein
MTCRLGFLMDIKATASENRPMPSELGNQIAIFESTELLGVEMQVRASASSSPAFASHECERLRSCPPDGCDEIRLA